MCETSCTSYEYILASRNYWNYCVKIYTLLSKQCNAFRYTISNLCKLERAS